MPSARLRDLILLACGALVVLLDQLTKSWVVAYFTAHPDTKVQLLGPVLTLDYVENNGVAFSLLDGQSVKFVLIALAIGVIGVLYWWTRDTGSVLLKICFGLVLGGAVGNLIDRFTHAYVVDFIHFQIPGIFDFAVFNVADSAISIGVILLALVLWREGTLGERTTRRTAPIEKTSVSAPKTGDQ